MSERGRKRYDYMMYVVALTRFILIRGGEGGDKCFVKILGKDL